MKRVTGIGGIFFKARDPKALSAWYQTHLGLSLEAWGGSVFRWQGEHNPAGAGSTVWSPFAADSDCFAPGTSPFMINYRVADLHGLLAALRAEGVQVEDKVDESELGKFGWALDPEGNKIELWEPPAGR